MITINTWLLLVHTLSLLDKAVPLVDDYYVLTESTERGRYFLDLRHQGASADQLVIKNRFAVDLNSSLFWFSSVTGSINCSVQQKKSFRVQKGAQIYQYREEFSKSRF